MQAYPKSIFFVWQAHFYSEQSEEINLCIWYWSRTAPNAEHFMASDVSLLRWAGAPRWNGGSRGSRGTVGRTAIQMECFLLKALSLHCSACSYLLCQAGAGGGAGGWNSIVRSVSVTLSLISAGDNQLLLLHTHFPAPPLPRIPVSVPRPPPPQFLAKDAFPPVCESGERKMLMDPKINVSRDSHSLHYKACWLVTTQRQSVSLRAA